MNRILCLVSGVFLIVSSIIPHMPYSAESIEYWKHNNRNYLSFEFSFQHLISQSPEYLPHFLISSLVSDFNLTHLEIRMGHIHSSNPLSPSHGIVTVVNSQVHNRQRLAHLLNGAFGTSKNAFSQTYQYSLNNQRYTLLSDTDDVFCGDTFERVLRMMPCGRHSGVLASLPTNMFTKYTSLTFELNRKGDEINYGIRVEAELDKSNENMLIRGMRCSVYNKSLVRVQNETMEIQSYSKVFELKAKQVEFQSAEKVLSKRWVSGNWYSHKGILSHSIQLPTSDIEKITLYEHLSFYNPPDLKNIQVRSPNNITIQHTIQIISSESNIVVVTVYPTTELKSFEVKIPYPKKVRNFELLKSSNRGSSEEFLKSVMVYKARGEEKEQRRISQENVIDKTIEPDNAMPFNILTFTMALIGYIWINVWKSYVKVNENDSQTRESEKEKSQ